MVEITLAAICVWLLLRDKVKSARSKNDFTTAEEATAEELGQNFLNLRHKVRKNFKEVMDSMPLDYTRKDFALKARTYEHSGLLFKILDGGNIGDDVWKLIKPAAE